MSLQSAPPSQKDRPPLPRARAALYATEGANALSTCARHAEHAGLRVVTVVDEKNVGLVEERGFPFGGARLGNLVDRLGHGEFDVIVAGTGAGRVVTITAADTYEEMRTGIAENGITDPVDPTQASARCIIYVRSASHAQGLSNPWTTQLQICEDYAKKAGWTMVATYKHATVSGRQMCRPNIDGLVAAVRSSTFDVLLVEDLCRLARGPKHASELLKELETLGVAVHTVGSGIVTSQPRKTAGNRFWRNCRLLPKSSQEHGTGAS